MNGTDEQLLEQMQSGVEEAFTELYRRHQKDVYRFALHMSGSTGAAEDVTQDVFLTLIQRTGDYRKERGVLRAFLFGIARNYVLRWLRSNRKWIPIEPNFDSIHDVDPLSDLTRRENVDVLRKYILSLPPKYREAIVLCDLHELDYETTAAVIGCSTGTVRSRLHRGRNLLLEKLGKARKSSAQNPKGGTYEFSAL